MFFNSLSFAVFLPVVFVLYWFVCNKSKSTQNILLIVSSYYFYSCWDWRFLFLLIFSTLLDYFSGLQIEKTDNAKQRKFWLWLSIVINLGFLGAFKYYDFFVSSFSELLRDFGFSVHPYLIKLILPVGISFYTFHGLSYIIDVYYKRINAERNVVDYALFVSYFPLLVAGPIERATHLIPQIKVKRIFNYEEARSGINQIVWGLFKKVVIADSCAIFANEIFENYESKDSLTLVLGAFYFAFQIYGDFSGYSDIALGTSKLFGIHLLKNFNYPYFSRDIAEFWRRWHISLSSWFRDYLYIPLGGSKGSKWIKVRNTFIIFLVSGFWHGANWTFIFWGLLNAIYFLPLLVTNNNRTHLENFALDFSWRTLKVVFQIGFTFGLTCLAWVFFRSDSLQMAFEYLQRIIDLTIDFNIAKGAFSIHVAVLLLFFILMEWRGRNQVTPLNTNYSTPKVIFVILLLLLFGQFALKSEFIYFQF